MPVAIHVGQHREESAIFGLEEHHPGGGEREVSQALRRVLFKYNLHTDQELFDKE